MADVLWQQAWQDALYGPEGFYRRATPRTHFRTSSHIPLYAEAISRLASDLDEALGCPPEFTVVDVGAGGGELLGGLAELAPARWELLGVDVAARPSDLPGRVRWLSVPPSQVTGLVMAHELLDVVPCPVVTRDASRTIRLLAVDPETGEETLGAPAPDGDVTWLERWWSVETDERAEVGRPRDDVWVGLVSRVKAGAALAVDYSHSRDDRGRGRWSHGSLTGHLRGRVVPPTPDGSCDLTARVALDSCAAAATSLTDLTLLTTQAEALRALGIRPGASPSGSDPAAHTAQLQRANEARELTDPQGLGGFGWLLQTRGVSLGVHGRA